MSIVSMMDDVLEVYISMLDDPLRLEHDVGRAYSKVIANLSDARLAYIRSVEIKSTVTEQQQRKEKNGG